VNIDTAAVSEAFLEQGYTVLPGLLSISAIDDARAAMNSLVDKEVVRLLDAGLIDDPLADASFETRMYRCFEHCVDHAPLSWRKELHLPGLYDLFFNDALLDIVEQLLGTEIRLYPAYTARPKFPEWEGTRVLWHQDAGYTAAVTDEDPRIEKLRMVNVWAGLVPSREANGCLQVVPGSHKLGVLPHESRTHYLEIASDTLHELEARAVSLEVDPGDVILFHNMLMHQGLPNRSDTIRWSLDWRYQDATQSTLRQEQGVLARSWLAPEAVVPSAERWAELEFG
jgi:hypothetical protein